jgi:D-arabinose 1-dehydrogenase-like Zn-dependent alcohol dehydrogenase
MVVTSSAIPAAAAISLTQNAKITAISFDGGYQEYMVAPAEAVAAMPDDLPAAEAAPLLDAGITVYNALRNSHARGGDLVAVQGIGGLGGAHLLTRCTLYRKVQT